MALWVIRGGQQGEWEDIDFEQGIIVIYSRATGLAKASDADELRRLIHDAYPDKRPQTIGLWTKWAQQFFHEMREGDLVLLPLKRYKGYVAIGEVTGPAEERPDLQEYKPEYKSKYFIYSRPVRWLLDRCPRDRFGNWFNRPHTTIHPVQEKDAEARVRELIENPSGCEQTDRLRRSSF